jgi:uncharacterized protein YejL (UPF0352 family)
VASTLVAIVALRDTVTPATCTVAAPAGWRHEATQQSAGTGMALVVFRKTALVNEPATYRFLLSASRQALAMVFSLSDCAPDEDLVALVTNSSTTPVATFHAPALTGVDGCELINIGVVNSALEAIRWPTPFDQQFHVATDHPSTNVCATVAVRSMHATAAIDSRALVLDRERFVMTLTLAFRSSLALRAMPRIADSGTSNELFSDDQGTGPVATLGNTWTGGGMLWTTLAPHTAHVWGAYDLTEPALLDHLVVYGKGGQAAQRVRAVVYADNGRASDASTDPLRDGARPLRLLAASEPMIVAANAPVAPISFALGGVQVPAGRLWFGLWGENVANGMQYYRKEGNTTIARVRANDGAMLFRADGPAPASFPTQVDTNDREEISAWVQYRPLNLVAPRLSVETNADRSVTLRFSGTDPRSHILRLERSRAEGAWATVAVLPADTPSFRDSDLQRGARYRWRVTACYHHIASEPSPAVEGVVHGSSMGTVDLRPAALDRATLVVNPLRGLHGNIPGAITDVPRYEWYHRTSFNWRILEPRQGMYDWSSIDAYLSRLPTNMRAIIRWRCFVPGQGNLLPDYLSTNEFSMVNSQGERIPRWNHPFVSGRMIALWQALGRRYGNNPRLAGIDAGGYNQYGEWTGNHQPAENAATAATQIAWIDAIAESFANKFVIMSLTDNEEALHHALSRYPHWGVRQDALGGPDASYMWSQFFGDRSQRTRRFLMAPERWRVCEHFGNSEPEAGWLRSVEEVRQLRLNAINDANLANFSSLSAASQRAIRETITMAGYRLRVASLRHAKIVAANEPLRLTWRWRNEGNGVLRDRWQVRVQLRDAIGRLAWQGNSSLDLRRVLPREQRGFDYIHEDEIPLKELPAGTYTLALLIEHSDPTRVPPLNLAQSERQAEGWYRLGQIDVVEAVEGFVRLLPRHERSASLSGSAELTARPLLTSTAAALLEEAAVLQARPMLIEHHRSSAALSITFNGSLTPMVLSTSFTPQQARILLECFAALRPQLEAVAGE